MKYLLVILVNLVVTSGWANADKPGYVVTYKMLSLKIYKDDEVVGVTQNTKAELTLYASPDQCTVTSGDAIEVTLNCPEAVKLEPGTEITPTGRFIPVYAVGASCGFLCERAQRYLISLEADYITAEGNHAKAFFAPLDRTLKPNTPLGNTMESAARYLSNSGIPKFLNGEL